jgi:signal recognition particle subunit SRP54
MFDALSDRLTGVLQKLTDRGVLTEQAVKDGLREIRRVMLEADVSYELTRTFMERVRDKAVGLDKVKAVSPGQQLVKIVYDELVALLGETQVPLTFASVAPSVVLLVGLQGSGKTTTAAKLAARLKREHKAPYLVAADVYRPAAEEQLAQLGAKVGVPVFGCTSQPEAGRDVVELVTAGIAAAARERLKSAVQPHEILLVADGMTGQDAVRIAAGFHDALGITGVILTKLDGDARGGAALSIYGVTGAPIKFVGTGEGMQALDVFDPERMAGRILQRGDVVGLVERAQAAVKAEEAERLAQKVTSKRGMDLEDFLVAMKQLQRMGPLESLLGMLPGVNAKALKQAKVDPKGMKHIEAIVLSMTPEERRRPDILNGSRRARIAKGSGSSVPEVNRLVKQFGQMKKMMKQMGKFGFGLQ